MKKNYYMKNFDISVFLTGISSLSLFIGYFLHLIANIFKENSLIKLTSLSLSLENFSAVAYLLSFLPIIALIIIIKPEIQERLRNDNLRNYIQSIRRTFELRTFLTQYESSQLIIHTTHHTNDYDSVNRYFNKTVKKSIVDIRLNSVIVFIPIPREQQGQRLLKEMESQIKEEISCQHPDYYFSAPIRERNQLWFIGTKR